MHRAYELEELRRRVEGKWFASLAEEILKSEDDFEESFPETAIFLARRRKADRQGSFWEISSAPPGRGRTGASKPRAEARGYYLSVPPGLYSAVRRLSNPH